MPAVTEGVVMNKAYLELDETKRLENAATNLRDMLLIRLLFHLGCRISEALALEVRDIDFTRLRLLQEQLGHVSFNTTAKYRKVASEELKD